MVYFNTVFSSKEIQAENLSLHTPEKTEQHSEEAFIKFA